MTEANTAPDAVAFLRGIAGELSEIRSGSDYSLWRDEAKHRVNQYLSRTEPFSDFATCWAFTGDGGGSAVGGRFGEWAIDRLVEKIAPEDIIALFMDEVARNAAIYEDVSPVLGIEIKEPLELGGGVRLMPPAADIFSAFNYSWLLSWPRMPTGTGFLIQSYKVTPAFEQRLTEASEPTGSSTTQPTLSARDAIRRRFRLACLLGTIGGVELPMSAILSDRSALQSTGGTLSGRPFAAHPLVAFPADMAVIKTTFGQLAAFAEGDSLTRAIDRLGRSRLAVHPVDRALDLGMAAEIVLMHDLGTSNTEITYKIGSRAAWLLGESAAERAQIFDEMKHLYKARSDAVHSGVLPPKSKVDLDLADQLVVRVVQAILQRGSFPDWTGLTLGAEG
jgi:hypothetical protein